VHEWGAEAGKLTGGSRWQSVVGRVGTRGGQRVPRCTNTHTHTHLLRAPRPARPSFCSKGREEAADVGERDHTDGALGLVAHVQPMTLGLDGTLEDGAEGV